MPSSSTNIVCPKCKTFLRPPFTTCCVGHLLCKDCRQHIDADSGESVASATCGDGQFPIPLLNKLLRDITDECQYGCGYRTNVVDLAKHEEACGMRSKCVINSCHWLGHITKLVKHVEDDHPGRLEDAFGVQHNFTLGFKNPVLLLTQWEKTSPNNAFYWLCLHKNGSSQFIMMQYAGQTGRKVEKKFLLREYSVSPVNYPKLSINIEVVFTKSDEDDILKDKFVESQGTDVTVFNSDEFLIKIKDVLPLISESLSMNLECFICAEMMSAPIRMCVTGHSFCDTCCGKIKNRCPKCQREIHPLARNYALETLTENLLPYVRIPCKYRDSGCQFINKDGVGGHLEFCEYQPKKCVYIMENDSCQWLGPYKYLGQHILAEHGKWIRPVNAPHLASSREDCYYYHYDNNYFVLRLNIPDKQRRCIIIFSHATAKSESNYNFKVNAFNTNRKMVELIAGSCKPSGEWSTGFVPFEHLRGLLNGFGNQLTIVVNISTKLA